MQTDGCDMQRMELQSVHMYSPEIAATSSLLPEPPHHRNELWLRESKPVRFSIQV
jgi:hypothetical protein